MALAIEQARRGLGTTHPNPSVGAVVVRGDDVIAMGYTRPPGGPHAEVVALDAAGDEARGAELFVTLEPCSHHGRTPPCTDRVIAAGISRVVVGIGDPNPLVAGRGFELLRDAGVQVESGVLEAECGRHHEGFLSRILRQRPFVTAKLAISLDGRIATRTGDSQWISGELSRRRVHELRSRADAILVGGGTLRADNPRLTTRLEDRPDAPSPARFVLDTRLQIPDTANVLDTSEASTTILTGPNIPLARARLLEERGARIVELPTGPRGRLDVDAILRTIFDTGHNNLLVEGGGELVGALRDRGLIDRMVFFVAPVLIGGRDARPAVGALGAATVEMAPRAERLTFERVGDDIMIVADLVPSLQSPPG